MLYIYLFLQASYQQIKNAFPVKKMQSMTELFLEALGTSSVIIEGIHVGAHNSLRYEIVVASWNFYATKYEFVLILNSMSGYLAKFCSDGLSGKLQQMMLKEKETDMDFWKKLKTGARPDSKTFDFTFSAFSILI